MILEVHPNDVKEKEAQGYSLIDVRTPEEYEGELGHIEGARLITLGEELTEWLKKQDKSSKIIFICRSGGRSGKATEEAIDMGVKDSVNMIGGMLLWNEIKKAKFLVL